MRTRASKHAFIGRLLHNYISVLKDYEDSYGINYIHTLFEEIVLIMLQSLPKLEHHKSLKLKGRPLTQIVLILSEPFKWLKAPSPPPPQKKNNVAFCR